MMKEENAITQYISALLADDRASIYFVGIKSEPGFQELKTNKAGLVATIMRAEGEHIYLAINGYTSALESRNETNLRQINAIFVDCDAHDLVGDARVMAVDRAIRAIDQAVEVGMLPTPTIIVHSGRGFHLYYVYADSIPCRLRGGCPNVKGKRIHRYLTRQIYALVQDAIRDTGLSVDGGCLDLSRYARVPGIFNPAAQVMCTLLYADGPRYTFAELFEAGRQ